MPASWKIALTTVLFCIHAGRTPADDSCHFIGDQDSVLFQLTDSSARPLMEIDEDIREWHWDYVAVDVSRILKPDNEWIRASTDVTVPIVDVFDTLSHAHRETSLVDDSEVIDSTVEELFEPLSRVHVTGPSSTSTAAAIDGGVGSLRRPDDLAAMYAESTFPGCYATVGYGVRRAPRNTHRFYANPLYYEDANLERCGRSKGCLTTACSALHFASRAALTPYLTTLDHPDSCVGTLPDCPTCHEFGCEATCPRWSLKAAVVQGGAVTGLIYMIP